MLPKYAMVNKLLILAIVSYVVVFVSTLLFSLSLPLSISFSISLLSIYLIVYSSFLSIYLSISLLVISLFYLSYLVEATCPGAPLPRSRHHSSQGFPRTDLRRRFRQVPRLRVGR